MMPQLLPTRKMWLPNTDPTCPYCGKNANDPNTYNTHENVLRADVTIVNDNDSVATTACNAKAATAADDDDDDENDEAVEEEEEEEEDGEADIKLAFPSTTTCFSSSDREEHEEGEEQLVDTVEAVLVTASSSFDD